MQFHKMIDLISKVQGVNAIALGGSQSRGEADQQSDYDIGVYYNADLLDTAALAQCLKELDDGHKNDLLNPPGQWGPWINGGAWLTLDGTPIDILLRDINRVEAVLMDCTQGKITIDYQCGHPFGFVNTIYAAETHYCKTLWQDESAPIDKLKALLYSKGEYSPLMKTATVQKFLWEAWFSLACGRKAAFKGDINYAVGSVFRTVCSWAQVLYALNNRYLMNEKGSLRQICNLSLKPDDMESKVKHVYQLFADGDAEKAYQTLDHLHSEIEDLSHGIQIIPEKIR